MKKKDLNNSITCKHSKKWVQKIICDLIFLVKRMCDISSTRGRLAFAWDWSSTKLQIMQIRLQWTGSFSYRVIDRNLLLIAVYLNPGYLIRSCKHSSFMFCFHNAFFHPLFHPDVIIPHSSLMTVVFMQPHMLSNGCRSFSCHSTVFT